MQFLWKDKRPELTRRVAAAAALGDRSENADYIYGKKQLREIDRRIRYLSTTVDQLQVVDQLPNDQSRVFFGAWVRILNDEGSEQTYRIVGADEFDPKLGWISLDSPVARGLLNHRVGDSVRVSLESGQRTMTIMEVSYAPIHE